MRDMPTYPNPLTDQDRETLTEICRSCHGTAELIQDCIDCGLPMDEHKAHNEAQHTAAKALKAKFFPGHP